MADVAHNDRCASLLGQGCDCRSPFTESVEDRLRALAAELVDPLICREPAYGVPGREHCAACCYGTGLIVTCKEEQEIADTAKAMLRVANLLESTGAVNAT